MSNNYWINHCKVHQNRNMGVKNKTKVPQMGDLGGRNREDSVGK